MHALYYYLLRFTPGYPRTFPPESIIIVQTQQNRMEMFGPAIKGRLFRTTLSGSESRINFPTSQLRMHNCIRSKSIPVVEGIL